MSAYRRQLSTWYRHNLENRNNVKVVQTIDACESAQHLFQIRVNNRDALMLALNEHGIYPGVHYRDNTNYRMYRYAEGTCPNAAAASSPITCK